MMYKISVVVSILESNLYLLEISVTEHQFQDQKYSMGAIAIDSNRGVQNFLILINLTVIQEMFPN